jgi:predicted GIY-YIG superfamily endonuclease
MVYLIHLEKMLCHAQHYIGYTKTDRGLDARMERHRANQGGRLLRACNLNGIAWSVVRTWPGETQAFERRLKMSKRAREMCPICREAFMERKRAKDRAYYHRKKEKTA